jgi:ABC-type nitrate/sulfonate/bicarbonate transport system substrate-binding protein
MRMLRARSTALMAATALTLVACGGDDGGGEATDAGEAADGGGATDDGVAAADDGGDGSAEGEPVLMRMGWGIPAEEIHYVMIEMPEVAPNNGTCYEVEWQQFAGTALGVQGIAAGTLDGATVGGLSAANGIEQGADLVLTGEFIEERSGNFSTAWMVAADSGIDSLEDLEGKTVATSALGGSTDYIQDFHIEEEAGLVAGEDYEKVEVPFGQQVEGIQAGQFDMGIYPQPFFNQLNAAGDFEVMFRLTDVIDPFVQLLQGFRGEFVEQNPEAVQCYMDDWVTVSEYVADPANRDAVLEASSAVTGIPVEALEGFLLTEDDFFRPESGAISVEALQNEWDFFLERGGISQELNVEDYLVEQSITDQDG